MSYESFDSGLTANEVGANNYNGPTLIDLLRDNVNKKANPDSWNPFLVPKIELLDSKEQERKYPTIRPAQPSNELPSIEVSDQPKKDVPAQTKVEPPVPPKVDGTVPDTKLPHKESDSRTGLDVLHKDLGIDKRTDGPLPRPDQHHKVSPEQPSDSSPMTTQTWGRFGRQFSCDATGNAVYEVRKGDTYSAVARDVLEKRNGRVYDVKNPADKNEILKFSRELADHNGVRWGKNNVVLIHPGDKIRIPAAQKPVPEKPPESKPPEAKPPQQNQVLNHELNHAIKPNEPSVVAGAFSIQPQNKLYNLLQPPGFEGQPGQSWTKDLEVSGKSYDIDKRSTVASRDFPNGDKQFMYSGRVDTGLGGTDFKAAEVVDAQGRIIARKIEYAEPLKMRVNTPSTGNSEVKVLSVFTRFDEKSGMYLSQMLTKDGQVYSVRYGGDGTVSLGSPR